MSGGFSRRAEHYDIVVSSAPSAAPVQSLAAIVKAFAAASERGDAIWRRGPNAFEIAQVRFNKTGTRAILLLRHKDAGADVSAHLVIDLQSSSSAYHAILEHTAGLTKQRVEQGLQSLASKLFEFYFKAPGGRFGKGQPRIALNASADNVTSLAVEREIAASEPAIRPDISAKLDALLRQRAAKRAA